MSPTATELTGVILSAGEGFRVASQQSGIPKCFLPVGNLPLAAHQIGVMGRLNVKSVCVALNDEAREAATELKIVSEGMNIHYHFQESPRKGIAHTLLDLRDHIDGPFLLFLGDIYLHKPDLSRAMMHFLNTDAECVLIGKKNSDPFALGKSFLLIHNERGDVTRVENKPRPAPGSTRGSGVFFLSPAIFAAIEKIEPSPLRRELELTDAIQMLIAEGERVTFEEGAQWDMNINTPEDLLECNMALVRETGRSIIDPSATLPEGSVVERSVIGGGVTSEAAVMIRESVVFPGTKIEASGPIVQSLVLNGIVYPCGHSAA